MLQMNEHQLRYKNGAEYIQTSTWIPGFDLKFGFIQYLILFNVSWNKLGGRCLIDKKLYTFFGSVK